jgi:hypothetical protein
MANEQNLIPISERTSSELREMTRKGGIASGKKRRERKKMREDLLRYLSEVDPETGNTMQENIVLAAVAKASSGDVRAIEFIRDTIGEKPDQSMTIDATIGLSDADRKLLKEANRLYASGT